MEMKTVEKSKKGNRGEVWKAKDNTGKIRPFVIVSSDTLVAEVDHTIAKVTTHEARNRFDVTLENWEQAGLERPSVVRCSKLNTIHNATLIHKMGTLEESDFDKVLETIRSYFV